MGALTGGPTDFVYGTVTLCGRPFHAGSTIRELCNSLIGWQSDRSGPTTLTWQRLPALTPCEFGLYPVRSPLLGASLLFSLPPATEMFHFAGFPLPALCVQAGVTGHDPCRVFPFGDPWIEACLAAPHGLSQPATSFIGFQRQGIHRVPFNTCRDDARARYALLKGRGWPPAGACAGSWPGGSPVVASRRCGESAAFKAAQCAQQPCRNHHPSGHDRRGGPPGPGWRAACRLASDPQKLDASSDILRCRRRRQAP